MLAATIDDLKLYVDIIALSETWAEACRYY